MLFHNLESLLVADVRIDHGDSGDVLAPHSQRGGTVDVIVGEGVIFHHLEKAIGGVDLDYTKQSQIKRI